MYLFGGVEQSLARWFRSTQVIWLVLGSVTVYGWVNHLSM